MNQKHPKRRLYTQMITWRQHRDDIKSTCQCWQTLFSDWLFLQIFRVEINVSERKYVYITDKHRRRRKKRRFCSTFFFKLLIRLGFFFLLSIINLLINADCWSRSKWHLGNNMISNDWYKTENENILNKVKFIFVDLISNTLV